MVANSDHGGQRPNHIPQGDWHLCGGVRHVSVGGGGGCSKVEQMGVKFACVIINDIYTVTWTCYVDHVSHVIWSSESKPASVQLFCVC